MATTGEKVGAEYFERYWQLGPARSLDKLAQILAAEREKTHPGMLRVLQDCSAKNHWQERVRQRVAEENEAVRERLQEQNIRVREEFATAFRTDLARYMDLVIRATAPVGEDGKPLLDKEGRPLGAMPVLITDTSAAIAAVKLLQALSGDPLPDRQEITGKDGQPVAVDFLHQFDDLSDEQLADVAESLRNGERDPADEDEGGQGAGDRDVGEAGEE